MLQNLQIMCIKSGLVSVSRLGLKTTTPFSIRVPMLTVLAGASMANCSSLPLVLTVVLWLVLSTNLLAWLLCLLVAV